jgi:DNA-binding protein H-NS
MARSLDVSELSREDLFELIEMVLDNLPPQDLVRVQERAEAKRQEKLEEAKNAVLDEMRGKLEGLGLSLNDVLQRPASRSGRRRRRGDSRQKAPAKYRSPLGEDWSGKGRVPKWLQILEAEGHSRNEYIVDSEEP